MNIIMGYEKKISFLEVKEQMTCLQKYVYSNFMLNNTYVMFRTLATEFRWYAWNLSQINQVDIQSTGQQYSALLHRDYFPIILSKNYMGLLLSFTCFGFWPLQPNKFENTKI